MRINQEFERLDNGDWVLTEDDMVTELSFAKFIQEAIVIKNNRYTNYSFDELPKKMFKGKRAEIREPDAAMRGKSFWNEYRQVELTKSEDNMGSFIKNIQNIKGFKYFMFGLTALIENSIEIGDPNPIDLTPVNTILTRNNFDGWRNRISATTTGNLWKRWFLGGYYAHAWGSHKNYYKASLDYSFIDKVYSPWEYPKRTLRLESYYDVQTPSDRFLPTDKDNFLVAFKWAKIDKMIICNRQSLTFEYEMYGGLKTTLGLKAEEMEAVGAMSFRTLTQPMQENKDIKVPGSTCAPPSCTLNCAMPPMRHTSTASSAVSPSTAMCPSSPSATPSASRDSLAGNILQTSPRRRSTSASGLTAGVRWTSSSRAASSGTKCPTCS